MKSSTSCALQQQHSVIFFFQPEKLIPPLTKNKFKSTFLPLFLHHVGFVTKHAFKNINCGFDNMQYFIYCNTFAFHQKGLHVSTVFS